MYGLLLSEPGLLELIGSLRYSFARVVRVLLVCLQSCKIAEEAKTDQIVVDSVRLSKAFALALVFCFRTVDKNVPANQLIAIYHLVTLKRCKTING